MGFRVQGLLEDDLGLEPDGVFTWSRIGSDLDLRRCFGRIGWKLKFAKCNFSRQVLRSHDPFLIAACPSHRLDRQLPTSAQWDFQDPIGALPGSDLNRCNLLFDDLQLPLAR